MVEDVYFLTVHDEIEVTGADAQMNATIVHARSFLHPALPQPDAARIYRCLTEFPGRSHGCLVPLSTLNYELGNGHLWPQVADWRAVIQALLTLAQIPGGGCDSMPLTLLPSDAALLASGPYPALRAPRPDNEAILGSAERDRLIADITASLPTSTDGPPLWPGDDLVQPPLEPPAMPYQPYGN